MRRPLTRKEIFYRVGFYIIVAFDVLFASLVTSLVYSEFQPTSYPIAPSIGFARPNTPLGEYDVAAFAVISIKTLYGPGFIQGLPINASINAFVNNPAFNATGNKIWFSFLNGQYWTRVDGQIRPGCTVTIGPPKEIELFPVNGTKGYEWRGEGTICFLYQGDFTPILTIDNGTKNLTYVQEGVGQNFVLTVLPPTEVQSYGFNVVGLLLAGALVFFAVIDSMSFLREIYPVAFPYRVEYKPQQRDHYASHTSLKETKQEVGEGKVKEDGDVKKEKVEKKDSDTAKKA